MSRADVLSAGARDAGMQSSRKSWDMQVSIEVVITSQSVFTVGSNG